MIPQESLYPELSISQSETLRHCSVCREPFPLSVFWWKKDGRIGDGRCSDCRTIAHRKKQLTTIQKRCDLQRAIYEQMPEETRPKHKVCGNPNCCSAGILQPPENFRSVKSTIDRLSITCRFCRTRYGGSLSTLDPKEAQRQYKQASKKHMSKLSIQWQKDNPEKKKSAYRKWGFKKFGVTEEWYRDQLARQDNKCAICGIEEGATRFHIDHNHNCCSTKRGCCGKCVRGLLCGSCNIQLGIIEKFKWVTQAKAYLRKYPLKDASGNDQPSLFDGM